MQKYSNSPKLAKVSKAELSQLLIDSKLEPKTRYKVKPSINGFYDEPKAVAVLSLINSQFNTVDSRGGAEKVFEKPIKVAEVLCDFGYMKQSQLAYIKDNQSSYSITLTQNEVRQITQIPHRKRLAEKIGLKKCSAAMYTNCDPKAMLVYEQMGGKWDSCSVWGMSPNEIQKLWFLAGCQNSEKFRLMLAYEIRNNKKHGRNDNHPSSSHFVKKHHSATNVANILRGLQFLTNRDNRQVFSNKQIETIGRVSLPLRYALITNCEMVEYTKTSIRRGGNRCGECSTQEEGYTYTYSKPILNFDYASKVQHWTKSEQSKLLSAKEAWFFLYGRCPFEGKGIKHPYLLSTWGKGASCFAKLAQEFNAKRREDMLLPILNLSTLFGSYGEVKRFVKDWTEKGIHDAGQFTLPNTNNWTPQKWAGFAHKYPEVLKFSSLLDGIEEMGMPKNLSELRDKASQLIYTGAVGFSELARWCNNFNLSQYQFENYKQLCSVEKQAESCPFVRVEKGDYVFYKLAHNDVRGPLLGLFTNCCQHLEGAGAACAKHGFIDPTSAFYVVEYKGKIVAQSWAWRSKKSDLVFDSIESLSGYDLNTISNLFLSAGQQIIGKLGIDRVLVGSTSYGLTSNVRSFLQNEGYACSNGLSEEMRSSCSYMDGRHQWLLTETGNKPAKFSKKETLQVSQVDLNCNTLLNGSDVYCEHCDAEVHPDCEICPTCHENIAEWV